MRDPAEDRAVAAVVLRERDERVTRAVLMAQSDPEPSAVSAQVVVVMRDVPHPAVLRGNDEVIGPRIAPDQRRPSRREPRVEQRLQRGVHGDELDRAGLRPADLLRDALLRARDRDARERLLRGVVVSQAERDDLADARARGERDRVDHPAHVRRARIVDQQGDLAPREEPALSLRGVFVLHGRQVLADDLAGVGREQRVDDRVVERPLHGLKRVSHGARRERPSAGGRSGSEPVEQGDQVPRTQVLHREVGDGARREIALDQLAVLRGGLVGLPVGPRADVRHERRVREVRRDRGLRGLRIPGPRAVRMDERRADLVRVGVVVGRAVRGRRDLLLEAPARAQRQPEVPDGSLLADPAGAPASHQPTLLAMIAAAARAAAARTLACSAESSRVGHHVRARGRSVRLRPGGVPMLRGEPRSMVLEPRGREPVDVPRHRDEAQGGVGLRSVAAQRVAPAAPWIAARERQIREAMERALGRDEPRLLVIRLAEEQVQAAHGPGVTGHAPRAERAMEGTGSERRGASGGWGLGRGTLRSSSIARIMAAVVRVSSS